MVPQPANPDVNRETGTETDDFLHLIKIWPEAALIIPTFVVSMMPGPCGHSIFCCF